MNETLEERAIRDKRGAVEREERACEALLRGSGSPGSDDRVPRRRWIGLLSALVGGAGGLVLGAYVGSTLAPPPRSLPGMQLDLSPLDYVFKGAGIGFLSGLLVGLTAWWASGEPWDWWRRHQ